jgi:hypothetical protein
MDTESTTIKKLFAPERRFLVPIFQRGYVWTQANQWAPLWEDIVDQALIVRRDLVKTTMTRTRKHFLGAIVVSADQNRLLHVASSSVIDGQQRLTTLQVLLAALRDAIAPLGNANLTRQATRLVENEGEWQDADERCKIWPPPAFLEDFRRIQTAKSPAKIEEAYPQTRKRKKLVPPRPPIVDAYLFFSTAIQSFLRGSDEPGVASEPEATLDLQRAIELLEAVQTYVQIVTIELGPEDDPQVIFETLNYGGVQLEPSDLIRNFIFLYAQRHNEDPNTLYEDYWREFDEAPGNQGSQTKWWREKERQGRLLRERLDLFAFHYITYRTIREIKISHLFQEFREWWNSGDVVVAADGVETLPANEPDERVASVELSRIKSASSDFKMLLAPDQNSRLGVFASRLKRLDTTTVYPLMLWLCENRAVVGEPEFAAVLIDLESYLIRRAVCGLTPKGYNHIFLDLLRKLSRGGAPKHATFRAELAGLQGESNLWPDDKRFGDSLLTSPLYAVLGPVKTQMVLEALELGLHTSKSEAVKLDGSLSVEHVLPQTPDEKVWPYLPDADGATLLWPQLRPILMHSLGNLTLLTQPLNSSVSNGPFSTKRPAIAAMSRLRMNAYFQRFSDADAWNEKQIAERGQELGSLAMTLWPPPGKPITDNVDGTPTMARRK